MLKNVPYYLAYVRKALIQVIGLVGALLALGLLPDKYSVPAATVVAVLTTILHYLTPNANAPGTTPAQPLEGEVDPMPDESDAEPMGAHAATEPAVELPIDPATGSVISTTPPQ